MRKHIYLFVCVLILFAGFCIYTFIHDHKRSIEYNSNIYQLFKNHNLTNEQISYISHDDDIWYYKGESLCVGFGVNKNSKCNHMISVCLGEFSNTTKNATKNTYYTTDSIEKQCQIISDIIKDDINITNFIDNKCPIVYSGHS